MVRLDEKKDPTICCLDKHFKDTNKLKVKMMAKFYHANTKKRNLTRYINIKVNFIAKNIREEDHVIIKWSVMRT